MYESRIVYQAVLQVPRLFFRFWALNNSGILYPCPFLEQTTKEWDSSKQEITGERTTREMTMNLIYLMTDLIKDVEVRVKKIYKFCMFWQHTNNATKY